MSKSQNLKPRIPSSTPVTNRKSDSVQKNNAPSIPRRGTSSRGIFSSSSSGSKQCRGLDSSESDTNEERMKKKHKSVLQVTMEAEKSKVPIDSVVTEKKKLTGHSFKSQFKRVREEETVSGKETSNIDGGRAPNLKTMKSTIEESSGIKKHYEDQEHIALEDNSADIGKTVNEVEKKCDKRMKKLISEQERKIQEFHRIWEDNISKMERDHKLQVSFIRSIYGKSTKAMDKLKILDDNFAKEMAENKLHKDKQFEVLEAEQLAARKEEIQKAASWLSEAKGSISSTLTGYCKEQSFGSQHEEVSRCSGSRTHILGAKDVIPLTEQHGENNDSSRTIKGNHSVKSRNSGGATAEEVACNSPNGNPSSATNSSQRNEGGISFSDIRIPAVVVKINQPKHVGAGGSIFANLPASGEKVPGDVQLLELHGEVPSESELPETVANEIVDNNNSVSVSTNTHLGGGEKTFLNVPASGERVSGEVQSLELRGDVLAELPETVANKIVDNVVDLSTNSPLEGFGEGGAIDLPDAEHEQLTQPKPFGCAERIIANLTASGERVLGDMQLPELCKDIPAELVETDAHEIVDNVNPVELSANTSTEGFGEGDAIDLPDALLNQRNENDRTTIDDLDLAGQVLKISEPTKASKHPYPLLPLQVREDQDVASAEIQGHGVQVLGKVNSSRSEIVASELVDTARESLSNIEPRAREQPAIATQSSSRIEVSTLKIIDTVIAEQSSIQLRDQDTSVVEDRVTSLIEAADSERFDTADPVAASELVGAAKTLESYNKLRDQDVPAIETQSTSRIEVSFPENLNNTSPLLSSTEQQDEDALIVTNQVNMEIGGSNSVLADSTTPVQSHTDAPPVESNEQLQLMLNDASVCCNKLLYPELESQNHNLVRNSSGAAETEMLSHESMTQLREDLEPSNFLDVGHDSQPSLATTVQISTSVQNNVATEAVLSTNEIPHEAFLQLGGVSHLPSDQVSPSLLADPLQLELQKIQKETEELQKSHVEMMVGLKSEYIKEIRELVDEVQKKYHLKSQDAQAQFTLKNNGLNQKLKKVLMNKLLASGFNFNCLNMWSFWPLMLQGFPSSSMQSHQHLVRLAGATAPNPHIARLTGQAVQQISVPNSTRAGPITSQHFAAPSVRPAPYFEAMSRHSAINGVHPMSLPHFGGDIYSSVPLYQSPITATAPSMPNATLISGFQNLQQQQQQQPLADPRWPSNSHNPRLLGYPPAVACTSVSSLDMLMDVGHHHRHHQLPGALQGNRSSCAEAATAICLSDDD
ncbi:uncharacterized protein LOC131000517 isoform X1 [Salvia miltiorrhiza]|uniref:uncharacterized protein LOC131000517 isoform X1 n=2 Tax=Salvia miltiorrhiza TaxID=226208 RepID=UPI0025AB88DD|nr:uncharacterized protein LOC131000517 isoform X1 [Salvia miltiorrhiza]XP_057782450.1 uncharacterized protein LOC131000517 isoform X1 [Salvia miltiorrhiza]